MSRRRITWSQAVALATLVLQAGGCTGWHTESEVSPSELVEQRHPTRLRVDLLSGGRVEMRDPVLRGDTLIGRAGRDTVRIAAANIATAARRRFSVGRTIARVGIGVGTVFGLALLGCAADPCGY